MVRKIVVLFVLFISVLTFNFQEDEQNSGVILTEIGVAKILEKAISIEYKIDLSQFYKIARDVIYSLEEFQNYCASLNMTELNTTCKQFQRKIEHKLGIMKEEQARIRALQRRKTKKRALPIASMLAWMEMVANVRSFKNGIEETQKQTNKLNAIINEQSLLLEKTLEYQNNTFNNVNSSINNMREQVEGYFSDIDLRLEKVEVKNGISTFYENLEFAMLLHSEITEIFFRCLRSNEIEFVAEVMLKRDISMIGRTLGENETLPIDLNYDISDQILITSKISTSFNDEILLFRIEIPILGKENLNVFQIIPIPVKFNGDSFVGMFPTLAL